MFFIHGGAFMAGTQLLMGPERLGDVADVVVVSINYRVGPLGKLKNIFFFYRSRGFYLFINRYVLRLLIEYLNFSDTKMIIRE